MQSASRWALVAAAALFAGCRVGPEYVEPEPELPDRWHRDLTDGLETGDAPLHDWWTIFQDEDLNELIARVDAGNLDLQAAYGRVLEARALLGIARGERLPAVVGTGGAERGQLSQDVFSGSAGVQGVTSLGVDASWEIDLWGRVSRSIESAGASYQATIESYRDVLVVLYAEVALTYMDLRAIQKRLRFAEKNVELQTGTRQLTSDRFDAQIVSELDVRQAELNLESTKALVPGLRILEARTLHRLAVLVGEAPDALYARLSTERAIPAPPQAVALSVPAEILRQRPDIRAAERELAAQTALIGVATAELYPQFRLNGSFGYDATGSVFGSSAKAWSFGPTFRWNLFRGGAVRSNIEAEKARADQAASAYEQTVLLALEEVENALVAYSEGIARRDALQRSVTAAERSVELVDTLYRTGITDFQNVLDTQRALVLQQDDLAVSEGQVVQALVFLYKALGGGWQLTPEEIAEREAALGRTDEAGDDLEDSSADSGAPDEPRAEASDESDG